MKQGVVQMKKRRTIIRVGALVVLLAVIFCSGIIYAEKIDLVMTCMASKTYQTALESSIKNFEKENPQINVKVEYYPYEQVLSVTEVKAVAKSSDFDIIFTDGPLVSAYTSRGYLEPLNKYFRAKDINQWVPAAKQAVTVNKKIMAAPLNNSTQILYYNKNLFKEMGIAPLSKDPKQRLTWQKLVKIATKLTIDKNSDGINDVWGFGFHQVNAPYQLLALPESKGAKAIGAKGLRTKGVVNSKQWIDAFQFYQDLFNKYKVAPKGVSTSEMPNYFISGRLAMFLGSDFLASTFMNTKDLEWDYAPHPYFAAGKAVTPTGSWCLGLSKYSRHKAAAAKLIRYITTAPGSIDWFKLDGHISPNIKTLDYIEKETRYNQWPLDVYKLAIYESKHTAMPRPVTPGYLEYEQVLSAAFEDIRNGSNVKETLSNAASRIDRMMLKYSR
jgi:ABC-type glycerol-3-phosphate transport system substrate-binding protein